MSTESTVPSPESSRSLSRGTSGTLEGILQQYSQKPELLELILMSKVQEDRRRAEEAKLRSKEIDYVLQRDRDREQAPSSTSYQHRHSLPSLLSIVDPSKLSSSPPLTNSSLGSPRSVPEPDRSYPSAESINSKDAVPHPSSQQQHRESPSISCHSTLLHPTIVQHHQQRSPPPSFAHHHQQQRSPLLLPSLMDTYPHHAHQQRRSSLPPPIPSSSSAPPKTQHPPIEPMSNMFSRKRYA